jgi:hypothetical protein
MHAFLIFYYPSFKDSTNTRILFLRTKANWILLTQSIVMSHSVETFKAVVSSIMAILLQITNRKSGLKIVTTTKNRNYKIYNFYIWNTRKYKKVHKVTYSSHIIHSTNPSLLIIRSSTTIQHHDHGDPLGR